MMDIHPNLWTIEAYLWAKVSCWHLLATVVMMNLVAEASRKQNEGRGGERKQIR
jgi:hypothetical protein